MFIDFLKVKVTDSRNWHKIGHFVHFKDEFAKRRLDVHLIFNIYINYQKAFQNEIILFIKCLQGRVHQTFIIMVVK